jgi:hypothetical protein
MQGSISKIDDACMHLDLHEGARRTVQRVCAFAREYCPGVARALPSHKCAAFTFELALNTFRANNDVSQSIFKPTFFNL